MSQFERDLDTLRSFTYDTPCQEVFERVKEKFTFTNNKDLVKCPTCGSACTIYSSGEGTNSFEPVTPYQQKMKIKPKD